MSQAIFVKWLFIIWNTFLNQTTINGLIPDLHVEDKKVYGALPKMLKKKLLEFSRSLGVNSTGSLCAQLAFRNCVTPRNMNPIGIFFFSSRSRETKQEKERRRGKQLFIKSLLKSVRGGKGPEIRLLFIRLKKKGKMN